MGALGGEVPYTAYNARKSYIEENPDVILGFSNAINKALIYTHNHTAEEIAANIADYFPDTSLNDLTKVINEYKEGDAWKANITINEDEWTHIQDIIIEAGELEGYAPYENLIYTKYFKNYE